MTFSQYYSKDERDSSNASSLTFGPFVLNTRSDDSPNRPEARPRRYVFQMIIGSSEHWKITATQARNLAN